MWKVIGVIYLFNFMLLGKQVHFFPEPYSEFKLDSSPKKNVSNIFLVL